MKKTILILLLVLTMLIAAMPMTGFAASDTANKYSDISNKWFTDAVTRYGYTEIFSDGSGKFNPNMKITRIEFVRLLHKAIGININYFVAPDVRDNFSDMQNTDIGANQLIDLATAGIVQSGGSFNPGKALDREIMIHWVIKALDYKTGGSYAIPKYLPVPFSDDSSITAVYKSDIVKSVVLQLVFGRGNNTLFPKDGATRAEAATIVMRLMDLLATLNKSDVVVSASGYEMSGALVMTMTVQNNSSKDVTIRHSNGQHYDFKLFDINGAAIYVWSMGKLFTMNANDTVIKPGESIVYNDTLDKDAYSALKAKISSMRAYIIGTSGDFTVDTTGYGGIITIK